MLDQDSKVFLYATIAHGSMALTYLSTISNLRGIKTIYLLGHIFISLAMMCRIIPRYRGSLDTSTLGIMGHSCLLLFFTLTTFIFSANNKNDWLNILCMIGQIGMISIYYIEYINLY